jgi:hypothetical protein
VKDEGNPEGEGIGKFFENFTYKELGLDCVKS